MSQDVSLGFNLRLGWQDQLNAERTSHRWREGYVDVDFSPLQLRLGRQIIAWGRADRINPTDVLSPRDFTLLSIEDEGQRLGIDAAKARLALGPNFALTAVVAKFNAHVLPKGALPTNLLAAPAPEQTEWAVKLDRSGAGVDWSLSYFEGYDRASRYRLEWPSLTAPIFKADIERSKTLGADFAFAASAWTWRGELAYAKLSPGCQACPQYDRSLARLVLGADRDLWGTLNLNLQWFALRRSQYSAPSANPGIVQNLELGLNRLNAEYARRESGLTMRLSDRALNEKLKWELSAIVDTTGRSYALRPRISYALSDHLKLSVGADWYAGEAQTYFGALKKNRLSFAMLQVVF